MNRRIRLLLIGRHYWPHGSLDSASGLTEFAFAMHRQGVHVEVVTPRYASSWPQKIVVREISVHRPTAAPRSDWSVGRYIRHLTIDLRSRAAAFDVMMVDSIREESMAAVEASRNTGCPVLLRCAGWGDYRDPVWWTSGRAARRCGTIGRMADAVVAKSAGCQRALLADGYDPKKIHRIDNGLAATPDRSEQARRDARHSLALMNGDLAAEDDAPVLLCVSRMSRRSGMNQLVDAARHLVAKFPTLRIWLIGDGPHRDSMYERLRGDGVRASIAMPGSFGDMNDVFTAADLFLQSDDWGLESFLPSAIANELPVVTVDTESTRAVIAGSQQASVATDGIPGLKPSGLEPSGLELSGLEPTGLESLVHWCPEATPNRFLVGVTHVLSDLTAARQRASDLRRILFRSRPYSQCVAAHVELMQQLIDYKTPPREGSSTETLS